MIEQGNQLLLADMTAADQDVVRALILCGLREHWGSIDTRLNPDLVDIRDSYASGRTVVGRLNGRVVATGTIIARTVDTAELVRMSVDSTLRRTGLGRTILEELLRTAHGWGIRSVVLETTTAWVDVVAFYVACGFSKTRTEDGEYGSDTWFQLSV